MIFFFIFLSTLFRIMHQQKKKTTLESRRVFLFYVELVFANANSWHLSISIFWYAISVVWLQPKWNATNIKISVGQLTWFRYYFMIGNKGIIEKHRLIRWMQVYIDGETVARDVRIKCAHWSVQYSEIAVTRCQWIISYLMHW